MNFVPVFDPVDLAMALGKYVLYYWLIANFVWAMTVSSNAELLQALNDWRQRCIASRGYLFWLWLLLKVLLAQPFVYVWQFFTAIFNPRSW